MTKPVYTHVNPALVGEFTFPTHIAVDRAMRRAHDQNPVGHHRRYPLDRGPCRWNPDCTLRPHPVDSATTEGDTVDA